MASAVKSPLHPRMIAKTGNIIKRPSVQSALLPNALLILSVIIISTMSATIHAISLIAAIYTLSLLDARIFIVKDAM